jgi:hypothetical protein
MAWILKGSDVRDIRPFDDEFVSLSSIHSMVDAVVHLLEPRNLSSSNHVLARMLNRIKYMYVFFFVG